MGSRLSDEGRRRSAKQYKKGRRRKKKGRAKRSEPIRVCPDCDAELPADSSEADSFSQRLVGVVAEGSDIGRLRFIRVGRAEMALPVQ